MKFTQVAILLCVLAVLAHCQEENKEFILKSFEIKSSNYDQFVESTKDTDYIVFFFSPECTHCVGSYDEVNKLQKSVEEYNKNATVTAQGKTRELKLAYVNGPSNRDLIDKMQVELYPTFIFYISGTVRFYNSHSPRTATSLLAFYTDDYYYILPEIPGVKRHYLTKKAVYDFYTKILIQYSNKPEIFWGAGIILALGLLLHPFLYRKN